MDVCITLLNFRWPAITANRIEKTIQFISESIANEHLQQLNHRMNAHVILWMDMSFVTAAVTQ